MQNRIPSIAIPWILIAASTATLTGAWVFQYVLGYQPCELCLLGRQPHYFAIGAALIAGILARGTNIGIAVLAFFGLCLVAYLAGAGISLYHAGVEYHWWAGPATCGSTGLVANSLDDLQSALSGGAKPPRCDEPAWALFGISLAGFNFVISLALAWLASLPLIRFYHESRGELE
ncbi:MAG: disulfide bond formation protein B [Alphaproteobacteria bacterium HGW-Alphaproteobacteria-12]|nr:MAG: disulfide bond formation protein B [Alphaproteobacteria bacterium HGW-Alphaproteobacteria-12]